MGQGGPHVSRELNEEADSRAGQASAVAVELVKQAPTEEGPDRHGASLAATIVDRIQRPHGLEDLAGFLTGTWEDQHGSQYGVHGWGQAT